MPWMLPGQRKTACPARGRRKPPETPYAYGSQIGTNEHKAHPHPLRNHTLAWEKWLLLGSTQCRTRFQSPWTHNPSVLYLRHQLTHQQTTGQACTDRATFPSFASSHLICSSYCSRDLVGARLRAASNSLEQDLLARPHPLTEISTTSTCWSPWSIPFHVVQSESHSHPMVWAQAPRPHCTALFGQLTPLQWGRAGLSPSQLDRHTSLMLQCGFWLAHDCPAPIYFPSLPWILLFVIVEMNL